MNQRYFNMGWNDARNGKFRRHRMADGLEGDEVDKILAYNNGYDAYLDSVR